LCRPADAQQAPGPSKAEVHKARGYHAWQRAVWRATPNLLDPVVEQLEASRAAAGSEFDASVGFMLGYAYLRQGRIDQATKLLAQTRKEVPDFVGYTLLDGLQLQQMERHADALDRFDAFLAKREVIRANPLFGAELEFLGLLHRGQSLLSEMNAQGAADVLEEALELSEKHRGKGAASAKIMLARARVRLEEFGVAEALLLEVLAEEPDDPVNYYHLALIHADQLDYEKAAAWYLQAVAHGPAYAEPCIKLAYLAGENDELATMRRYLETYRALISARQPSAGAALPADELADIEAGLGKYWEKVGDAREAQGDDAGAARAWTRSVEHYEQALLSRPTCAAALKGAVEMLGRLGDRDAELERYRKRLADLKLKERRGATTHRSTFC